MEKKLVAFSKTISKTEINKICRNRFTQTPEFTTSDIEEVFEFLKSENLPFVVMILDDTKREEIEKDKGGRPTGSTKEPDTQQLEALNRELDNREYRKEKLKDAVNMTLPTFRRFLKDNPLIEERRLKNQVANRNSKNKSQSSKRPDDLPQT